jgi:arylsulfatase A-like enzyme/predicted Zn-dependent protease
MRKRAPLSALLAAALACAACARDGRPDIVLVTLDTTRADRIGAMGDASATTPVLDALAARGAVFERAYASAPRTLPSHTTMLTGLDPNEHGVHDNGAIVPADLATLAERLSARGYATAAFVAAFVLDSRFGLSRGFEHYDDEIRWESSPLDFTVPQRRGGEVTDRALAWLDAEPESPYFLWVHYFDPHMPRDPPSPFDEISDRYAAEIAYTDAQLGRLLDGTERASGSRDLVVLVVGDHGEALGDHDEQTHGILAYDATLHVPLIASGPGFPSGSRSDAFVQTRDVAATLLAAAGESGLPGFPLQSVLAGQSPGSRIGYFESVGPEINNGWARIGGVRDARWKYTAEPDPVELYDTANDPGEAQNRADARPEIVERLAGIYAELRRNERVAQPPALSPDVRERLEALGYASTPVRFAGEAPDPRRLVGSLGWIERARAVAAEGRVGDAIRALEVMVQHPQIRPVALQRLAPVYLAAGRNTEAAAAYEELVGLGIPEMRTAWAEALLIDGRFEKALAALGERKDASGAGDLRTALMRVRIDIAFGRNDEALAGIETLLAANPRNDIARALRSRARAVRDGASAEIERLRAELATEVDAFVMTRTELALLLSGEGRDNEALRILESFEDPSPDHLAMRAEIALRHGNPERAARLYGEALDRRPHERDWLYSLADLDRGLGRFDAALALYDELIAARPGDSGAQLDRGAVLLSLERWKDAEAAFQRALEIDPELAGAEFNLALIALKDGREQAAEGHLQRTVALRPDHAKAHYLLAKHYRVRGDSRASLHAEQAAARPAP